MKGFGICALVVISLTFPTRGQNRTTDSLLQVLKTQPADTNRVILLLTVADRYYFSKPDSGLILSEQAIQLARELQFTRGEIWSLNEAGEALRFMGNYPGALKYQMEALELNRKLNDVPGEVRSLGFLGYAYVDIREYHEGIHYLQMALKLSKQTHNQQQEAFSLTNIGNAYALSGRPDSALYYQRQAFHVTRSLSHGPLASLILSRTAEAFASLETKDSALFYFRKALKNSSEIGERLNPPRIYRQLAELHDASEIYDSSLYYARLAIVSAKRVKRTSEMLETSNLLVKLFRRMGRLDSAFVYEDLAKAMNDSLYGPQKIRELQLLMLKDQQRQQQSIRDQEQFVDRIKYTSLLMTLAFLFLIAFVLFRNNRIKQKANDLLNEQKNQIERTLNELKSTQTQLVQREKMASLGELTAGIAHEIQNPLNFINNFSEVNKELLLEMKDEMKNGKLDDADTLADSVINNEEKIIHHGKRADAIVKGMLQHSRSSSRIKVLTDVNALVDEYFRLAYHGLRAKDKSFNATMKTEFDERIGKINIVPQEMGRVILNLITNAFYAVNENRQHRPDDYEPTVTVTTSHSHASSGEVTEVVISVKDNGGGIPNDMIDKIFQPFFTSKPAGQGTGLGLSLSYDIVKAHGGELNVKTSVGEGLPAGEAGSEFTVTLPVV